MKPTNESAPDAETEVGLVEAAAFVEEHPVAFAEKTRRGKGPVAYKDSQGRWNLNRRTFAHIRQRSIS
jgi:hypothetical protein